MTLHCPAQANVVCMVYDVSEAATIEKVSAGVSWGKDESPADASCRPLAQGQAAGPLI